METQEHGTEENVGLLVLEAKSLRPFKTKDEYLYAMKEDLAEWFKCLYAEILIDAENFLEVLETGVMLCQHANEVRKFTAEQKAKGEFAMKSNFVRDIQIPQYDVQFRIDVKPGTFLARDNISNFITWTAKMGIPEVLRFETDDLVLRKNERSVVLCLLEVARVGAKFGMLAPTIVQMEEEIDNEIETGEPPPQIKTCDIKSLDEMVRELVGRCTCPVQFPIIKVGEGKYKIGDNQTLVFVRILRKHVMIRVGGGWDTLEHYLDRHDPCRCRFDGHRPGRGPSTPRRASSSSVSHSQPNTPKTPRKLSMTTPIHSGSVARPASPGMRSSSPGPNSKKLSLVVKGASNSQPSSCVTSPNTGGKMPNFSNTGSRDMTSHGDVSGSGNLNVGNFVKQSQNSISRQLSYGSGGGTLPRQTTPRRSASPAFRAQSPGPRRSESPAPIVSDRLRSPSPVHSKKKAAHVPTTQVAHASRNGRCESPMKQITLSELRSSREGKPATAQKSNTPRSIRRQTSTTSSNGDEMASDPNNPSLTIDKISTMSLGEFKSLLNSALSVPNGAAGSQASSDSPRSQSSIDGHNKKTSIKSSTSNKNSAYRSAPGSRSTSANRGGVISGSGYYPVKSGSIKTNEKAHLDSSSSGYSTASSTTDRVVRSSVSASNTRSRTPSGKQSATNSVTTNPSAVSKSVSNSSIRSNASSTTHNNKRAETSTPIYKSTSNSSNISEHSNTLQPGYRTNYASRSSSHSSLKSYESTDSHSFDDRASQHSDHNDPVNRDPLTPSSATSDYSLRNSYTSNPDSPGQTRSNTYNSLDNVLKCGHSVSINSSCSEKMDVDSRVNGTEIHEENPRNVGYAYMFSYSDKSHLNGTEFTKNGKQELDELESELAELTAKADNEMDMINKDSEDEQKGLKQTPARSHTPSFIPRPITPKISRKPLSTPHAHDNDSIQSDDKKSAARPPTPRKSNIIARAPAAGTRSADKSKEQTYREIFQKRSMTPGPDSRSTTNSNLNTRRSSTPGPYLQKSNLNSTSATTTRARLNESLEQKNKGAQLSVYNGDKTPSENRSRRDTAGGIHQRSQSMDRKALIKQYSIEKQQPETVIIVNRANGQHSLDVQGADKSPSTPTKSKVLARARNEDTRSRVDAKRPITRQRPQSVEPKQLMPRKQLSKHNGTTNNQENEDHEAYNRTQEWVQTAVAQTKVQKPKTPKVLPRSRRAMTPNSFDMHKDVEDEGPRSLDEIKAALSLPINGITTISIDPDNLEAPPEDPELYLQMEKLFNELRQQELKNSVNETPGVGTTSTKSPRSSKSKSKSNSSANDEELSLDSNRNVRKKSLSLSTKSSSNLTSPSILKADKGPSSSLRANAKLTSNSASVSNNKSYKSLSSSQNLNIRPSSPSPKVDTRNTTPTSSVCKSRSESASSSSSQRPPSPRTTTRPMSPRVTTPLTPSPAPRPASAFKVQSHSQKSSTSSTSSSNPPRPASPGFKSPSQTQRSVANPPRPSSPAFKAQSQKASTPTTVSSPRPASPAFKSPSQPSKPLVSSPLSQPVRPSSPSVRGNSTTPSTPRSQPSRPSSTPPRPSTPVSRQSSKASDDSVFESQEKKDATISGSGLLSKLKEIIKVKPRKDKQDKVKTRIPAPKSLANHRKSQSFSNLTHLSDSMSLAHTCPDIGKYAAENEDINPYPHENGWTVDEGLNATLSSKTEPPQPRLITPLNTGRSTLIRKESMDKNKEFNKIARAVSVERNINSINRYPYLDEGEYV